MIVTILVAVSVTIWCVFSFALYGYHYFLEVILDLPIVGESPCSAHTALKQIIQKIIREANDLPKLRGEGTTNALDQENRTYEDLLSTAILNKIISSSQHSINSGGTPCSSRANSVCSHRSSSSRRKKFQKEYFFGGETLENKWKNIDTDTASVSSLEEWVHSDSSLGSTKYVDRLSLTIKQRIEEVSSSESEQEPELEENDDAEYFRSNSAFSNDQPNWFLQKRQFRGGTSSPVPVPMLVPDPTSDAKVLIGDKEIDDTSDLSDVPSDFEEDKINRIASIDVKTHLVDSKTLIGGKNPLADLNLIHLSDDEISADSGVKECKDFDEMDSEIFSSSKKHENEQVADASIFSDGSSTERDTEYTEKYATLPRTILISPENNRLQGNQNNSSNKQNENDNAETNDLMEESNEENEIEFTGVYSQREKEKWKHAVELKNNPYSKENIERRIKSRNSINSLFGSDYYIRQASLPSGAKRTEVGKSVLTVEKNIQQKEHLTNGYQDKLEDIPQQKQNGDNPFIATPVNIDETTRSTEKLQNSNSLQNSLEISDNEIHLSSEITSDSDVSLVNCYDVTESVVYSKLSANNNEEIQTAEKFFDFESPVASLNHIEETKEQDHPKPVAKPRRRTNSEQVNEIKMQIKESESDPVKLVKYTYKNTNEDNFDTIPYIISKRSDNTLIKKIYDNPSVRSFALNNRNKLPISVEETTVVLNKKPVITKTVLRKQKSLSEINEETDEKVKKQISLIENNEEMAEKTLIFPKHTENIVFCSTPLKEKISNIISQDLDKDAELNEDDQLECFYAQAFSYSTKNLNSDLEEINNLKEQKLVANRLKEFSKSTVNLSQISEENLDTSYTNGLNRNRKISADWENVEGRRKLSGLQNGERSTSVKDLRKRFEQFDANAKAEKPILYSLTGRSISKQFKEKLRDLNGDIPNLSQIHSLSLTNLEVEENTR